MALAAAVACVLFGMFGASSGHAQHIVPGQRSNVVASDPATLEQTLNPDEKKLVQEGLAWVGFYKGWFDGAFGEGTRTALSSWQRQNGLSANGELDADQAVTLAGTALAMRDKTGWQPISDSKSGIVMSYPSKVLTKRSDSDAGGITLDDPDGGASLMTMRFTDVTDGQINSFYDALSGSGESQITYEFRRNNLFIVTGNRKGGKFYSRFEQRGREIRGYDLIWRADHDADLQALSVLISNSFYPFGYDTPPAEPSYPTLMALADARGQQGGSTGAADTSRDAGGSQQASTGAATDQPPNDRRPSDADATPSSHQDGQADSSDGEDEDGQFAFAYLEPKSPELKEAYELTRDTDLLRRNPEIDWMNGMFELPRQLRYVGAECGTVNAFYSPKDSAIVLCYELVASLEQQALKLAEKADPKSNILGAYIASNIRFILLHETGHALIDMLNLPSTGREEDAVDQMAAMMILLNPGGKETSDQIAEVLRMAAIWFQNNASVGDDASQNMQVFADEHSLSEQRFYNLLCYMYGHDSDAYDWIVREKFLPEARAARCFDESRKMFKAWAALLAPHFTPRYQAIARMLR
jgi:peptidoglycan hydrolase-like protein with peptidoglycan-binding domain